MSNMKTAHIEEFIDVVWNQGNTLGLDQFISPLYTIHHDPNDPWDGKTLDRADFRNRVDQSRAPVPDQIFDIKSAFEDSHSVCITWLWEGTHKGPIAGFPATGKKITMSGATVYNFQNALICGHWQVADRLSIFQQLQHNTSD